MRKTCTSLLCLIPFALLSGVLHAADSPAGRWKTIDDETGRTKSVVEIQQAADGSLSGKVVDILQSDKGPNPVCERCDGEREGQPIKGMTILWDLRPDGPGVWSGGSVLDPAKGKTYRAKITLAEDGRSLDLRGYIGIEALGRTQTWKRE